MSNQPEQENQQFETVTLQEIREAILADLEASKQEIAALSDEELEQVAGEGLTNWISGLHQEMMLETSVDPKKGIYIDPHTNTLYKVPTNTYDPSMKKHEDAPSSPSSPSPTSSTSSPGMSSWSSSSSLSSLSRSSTLRRRTPSSPAHS